MSYGHIARIGAKPGCRDELVSLLTGHSDVLPQLGCLTYEVGTSTDEPDTVFVLELWSTADEHARSLKHPDVQASMAAGRPLMSGVVEGFGFEVVGSPLRP